MDVYAAGSTVHIYFTTNAADGSAVAPSSAFEAADVKLYKDGSATQRSSESGWTMTSPFDSITGLHLLAIDLSDNTDAGFYADGSIYTAVLSPDETVDSVSVASVIGRFKVGTLDANVGKWSGTTIPGVDTAGYPKVTVKDGTGAGEIDTNSGQVALTAASRAAIVDEVWDEILTGATHNIQNSAGRILRTVGGMSVTLDSGTAQAGASTTITLKAGSTSVTNAFLGCTIAIDGGTGLFQARRIIAYNGTTKVATVDRAWNVNPDNTSTYDIYANSNPVLSDEGTAQAGGASTITLRAAASAVDDTYNNAFVTVLSDTGSGQTRIVSDYVGATKVATVDVAWDTEPDNTSIYAVIPNAEQAPQTVTFSAPSVDEIWSKAMTELSAVPGVTGSVLEALEWVFLLARNKRTQTATTETLRNNADNANIATSTKADAASTFTRGKWS